MNREEIYLKLLTAGTNWISLNKGETADVRRATAELRAAMTQYAEKAFWGAYINGGEVIDPELAAQRLHSLIYVGNDNPPPPDKIIA